MPSIEALKLKRKLLEASLYKKIDQINKAQAELNRKRDEVYDYYYDKMKEIDDIIVTINGRGSENLRP
jgi:hypothetical protein